MQFKSNTFWGRVSKGENLAQDSPRLPLQDNFSPKHDLRPKGRGRKLVGQGEMCMREYVVRPFECHFLIRNELPFDVADLLTTAYHDLLARMHHNHSTHPRQHCAASTLLVKYKVPQPNALRLSYFENHLIEPFSLGLSSCP